MKRRSLLAVLVFHIAFRAAAAAEEPKTVPADRVIGRVYGKAVTAGDVGLTKPIDVGVKFDASDRARWEQMSRIQMALGLPIQERFVREKKLAVTDHEIAQYQEFWKKQNRRNREQWEERLAVVTKELALPNLSPQKPERLRYEKETLERILKHHPQPPTAELVRQLFLPWKIERELHRAYGGRIIFQQFGPEALDARRKLYEAAEAAGDLKFEDPGVRHLFYYYANMRHVVVDDDKALEKPWFFEAVE